MRILPLVTLSVFVIVDVAANWRALGMVSVSEQVWGLEDRFGWWVRAGLVLAFVPVLGHLFFRWPYGP